MRRTRQCRVLYFEEHGEANAAGRGATAMTHSPVTPPMSKQEGRQAASTPKKQPVKCQRSCGIHEGKELQEKLPCEEIARVMRTRQRDAEVKEQHDCRCIFIDREEIYPIIDCLEELVGAHTGAGKISDWYLLSMSTCRICDLPEISDEVRLRRVQYGPELGMASVAQRNADEQASPDRACS